MKKIKTTTIEQLERKTTLDIIIDLRAGRYSLLESLGLHDMKREMNEVEKSCERALKQAERAARAISGDYHQNLRSEMSKVLSRTAPMSITSSFPHPSQGIVFGFNHPTLGEIFRLINICITEYPNRKYLFPVNIVWYESLAPFAHRMEMFGLYITPTISPATHEKLAQKLDALDMRLIDCLESDFNTIYLEKCVEFLDRDDIVMVAPSATRRATLFRDEDEYRGRKRIEPQTMTVLAMKLIHKYQLRCFFIPLAIVPPADGNRGLNLNKLYKIRPCDWFSPNNVRSLCKKDADTSTRRFEHAFLMRIAHELEDMNAENLIIN